MRARGLSPPQLGSIEDEVLRTLDERRRNLRLAEVNYYTRLLVLLFDARGDRAKLAQIDEWLDLYAAELYGDVYVPEWQVEQRRALQRKRAAEKNAAEEKARLMRKVDKFG